VVQLVLKSSCRLHVHSSPLRVQAQLAYAQNAQGSAPRWASTGGSRAQSAATTASSVLPQQRAGSFLIRYSEAPPRPSLPLPPQKGWLNPHCMQPASRLRLRSIISRAKRQVPSKTSRNRTRDNGGVRSRRTTAAEAGVAGAFVFWALMVPSTAPVAVASSPDEASTALR